MKHLQSFRQILAFFAVIALFNSCKNDLGPESKPLYIQYQPLVTDDDFRPMQNDVVLTDYLFEDKPYDYSWVDDKYGVYADTVKLAALAREGKVIISKIRVRYDEPSHLNYGYHILSDGGSNPAKFDLGSKGGLVWMNSNYPVNTDYDQVKINLVNYPKYWNLKFWFIGSDIFTPEVTAQEVQSQFTADGDGADFDSGFFAGSSYTFRAPRGYGFIVVKTPKGTYQAQKLTVGLDKVVTFTAP